MASRPPGMVSLPLLVLVLAACGPYSPSLDSRVNLGRVLLLQDKPAEAAKLLEAATALDASAPAQLWYGRALEELGRFDAAAAAYEQALRIEDAPAYRVRVAALAARMGDRARAVALLRSALGQPSRWRGAAALVLARMAHSPRAVLLRWAVHDDAGETLLRVLVESGDDAGARELVGQRGWGRPAAAYCAAALPDLSNEAQAVLAMVMAPGEATCLYEAGISLAGEGHLRLARRLLRTAAEQARSETERHRIDALLHHRLPAREIPVRAESLVAAGIRLDERYQLPAEARSAYDAALEIDPAFSWAARGIASLWEDRDESAEALAWYQRAVDADANDSLAQLGLGRSAYALRRYALAAAAYRRALQLDDTDADAFASLGMALAKLGREAEAAVALEAALSRDPNHAEASQLLAERRGLFDAQHGGSGAAGALAQAAGLQAAGRWNEAARAARHAAALESASSATQLAAADVLEAGGDVDGARELHVRAEALEPNAVGVLAAGSGFALRVGDPARALALSDRVAATAPWFADGLTGVLPELGRRVIAQQHPALVRAANLRIDVLLDAGRLDEARALARRYAVVRSGVDYCALAQSRLTAASRDATYAAFRRAVLAQPDQVDCVWWFGQWLTDEGQVRLARTMVVEARRAAPGQSTRDSAERYVRIRLSAGREVAKPAEHLALLARRRLDHGDAAQARRLLIEALRRDPGFVSPYNLLARLDWEQGDAAAAIVHLERGLQVDAESWRTRRNLGMLLGELHRLDEAEAHLRRAVELFDEDVGAHVALARVLYEARKFEAYAAQTRRALAAGAVFSQSLPDVRAFLEEFERGGPGRALPPSRVPRIALGWNAD